ncbi:MAG: hypothetical protein M1376_20780 [Planctomycetes bacterium]|nr:hypothetical protein [Planctomycetota bacterium]
MLLQIRPIAVRCAVLCFFAIGIVGALGGLAPYTCCQRAVLGAAIAYVVAGLAARAVNAILTQAMIADRIRKGNSGDNRN